MKFGPKILCLFAMVALFLPAFSSAEPPRRNFYGSLAGKLGYGKASSLDGTSVPSRVMLVPALEGVLALRWNYFLLGVGAEYALWQQYTNPSGLADSNVQGAMIIAGPVLGISAGSVRLLARLFPLYSSYDLSRPSVLGVKQAYTSAAQLGIQVHFQSAGSSFWGIEYAKTEFSKREALGTEFTLAAGNEMQFKTIGVVYGFSF
ncbi:MAG: hypothetical protein AB7K68_13125 [Bacteriovoracia bacterium]